MTNAILDEATAIDGIDLTPQVMASPEGKSFLSLLPIMTFLRGRVDGAVAGVLRQLARLRIEAAIGTFFDRIPDNEGGEVDADSTQLPSIKAVNP